MVFDFGGGTLDVTVLEMVSGVIDVLVSDGEEQLGGIDIDNKIEKLILDKFVREYKDIEISDKAKEALRRKAEEVKIALSDNFETDVNIFNFAETSDGTLVDLEIEVSREEMEREIAPILEKARECIFKTLKKKNILTKSINRVLLIGGTTYIPAVRKMVEDATGIKPSTDVNPDQAVVIGASIQAALSQGLIDDNSGIILTDVAPYGLGTDVLTMVGDDYILVYDPLIEPNTTIPYSVEKSYQLITPDQGSLAINLYQDRMGNAKSLDEVIEVGASRVLTNIPPSKNGKPHEVLVSFSYDINGIARLNAVLPATNQQIEIMYTQDTIIAAEETAIGSWSENENASKYKSLINRAESLLETLSGEDAKRLKNTIKDLKYAIKINDNVAMERAEDALINMFFDLGL